MKFIVYIVLRIKDIPKLSKYLDKSLNGTNMEKLARAKKKQSHMKIIEPTASYEKWHACMPLQQHFD